MEIKNKAYLQMHFATFLWGITAILGKLISINEFYIVWYRVLLVSIFLLFIPSVISSLKNISKKDFLIIGGIGIILTTHWLLWYGAIKYSNASVAVCCIACCSFFIAIIEPFIYNIPFNKSNLLLGLLVIPGILLINQSLDFNLQFGFFLGIISAILAAIFSILNKKYTQQFPPNTITFIQLFSGLIFLSIFLPFYLIKNSFAFPNIQNLILLIVLATFCTIVPYNLFLKALKASNAFTTSLINNLEPVYGVILAAIILNENQQLNWKFYFGATIIVIAVFIHAFMDKIAIKQTST